MTYPISGSCQCGQLTYQIKQAPNLVLACHCKECQKLSTSPFSVTAVFPTGAIEFKGELKEWTRPADSGNKNSAKFCPDCGNRVYHFNPADLSTLKLKLKPTDLEDDSLFEPTVHVWVSEKQSWYDIPQGVKVFDKQP
ncbi:GFA family protein [Vibrio lamellibrachiae]|uniref:GFA family protein n=1 Tax=Vibrio lamellibrachiae TaxID=2910253 RepID=UPI003D13FD55